MLKVALPTRRNAFVRQKLEVEDSNWVEARSGHLERLVLKNLISELWKDTSARVEAKLSLIRKRQMSSDTSFL